MFKSLYETVTIVHEGDGEGSELLRRKEDKPPEERKGGRRGNPHISQFRERLEWIRLNLDPYPGYTRFIGEVNDIYKIMDAAVAAEVYDISPSLTGAARQPMLTKRTWEIALSTDSVSEAYIDWLCALFPDLTRAHLCCETLDEFLALGKPIEAARNFWARPIQFYSTNRKDLHTAALNFYSSVKQGKVEIPANIPFPLLTKPQWIRSHPMQLKNGSELKHLESLGEFKEFEPRRLEGLLGPYINYRAMLGRGARKRVRPEPQHNGEIFCADEVICDDEGFVGFRYFLAHYFDYINTGEVLGAELAESVLANGVEELPSSFPFRGAPNDAFNLANRAAYPGINCLTIFLNHKEKGERGTVHKFLLHKRDETQLQAQNTIHVVPAGGHQGLASGAQKEDSAIWRTLVREFAEELFDKENLSRQYSAWRAFEAHPEIREINDVFFDGPNAAAAVYLHGFGLDPITLKPEVLCTIIIDWSKVPAGMKLKYNWELQTADPKVTRHQWVPLSKESLIMEATQRRQSIGDKALDALPAGAACLLLTAQHYEFMGLPKN